MLRFPFSRYFACLRGFAPCFLAAVFAHCLLPARAAWAVSPLRINGLGASTVAVDGKWQFHLGDDPAWAAPELDDETGRNGWEEITADASWGAQTHFDTTGYAWYRKRIEITVAPGAAPGPELELALMIPVIDEVYEVYWNGRRVGGLGRFPPRLAAYSGMPAQIYNLGPARSGVLAVRVFQIPFSSIDDGTAGGFETPPLVGSTEAIQAAKAALDYGWLRSLQFQFALTVIYTLVSLLSLLAWLRDRAKLLLLWMAIYTAFPLIDFFLNHARLPITVEWQQLLLQIAIQFRNVSLTFVLLWLLQLVDNRRLVRFFGWYSAICIFAGILDGCAFIAFPRLLGERGFQIVDALLTLVFMPEDLIPLALVGIAAARRRRLDSSAWLVAAVTLLFGISQAITNVGGQGARFTRWELPNLLASGSVFTLVGSAITVPTILRTLFFLAIVYAVIRYALDELRQRSTLESEFRNARELQQVLVPETQPAIPGFTLTSAYIPAREVGGDFYQILPAGGGSGKESSTLLVLGDVSGKGLRAAMAVSLIVGAIRTLAETTKSPAALLAGLNRQLYGRLQGGFATCIALRLDADGSCTIASAGHPAPFVNGRELELPGALPVGVAPDAAYAEETIQLDAASRLALYTDGLVEARKPTGELYGFARMQELFGENPTAAQAADAAVGFGQDDDITVLTLARTA
jgi:hypothetical protein